ncbi:MAG: hypothetical protein ABEJ60_06505 [Halodesulfurarchaeum sp.]
MSSPSHTHDSPSSPSTGHSTLLRPLEAAGFWAAVALPFIYVPLVLRGLDTSTAQITVAVLIVAHVLALVLGRTHRAE